MKQIKAEKLARLQTKAATEKSSVYAETAKDELIVRYSQVSKCFVYPEPRAERRVRLD